MPATTRSPTRLTTGRDSPVIIASSSSASPSTTTPSAGTRPPGRTSTTSPTRSASSATGSTPSAATRSASSGNSAASAASAPCAWPMARISNQWPSSMIVTSVASSNQRSTSIHPISVATDAPNATTNPIEMSSIIPGRRARSSSQPPRRKTGPPQANVSVPNSGATNVASGEVRRAYSRTSPEPCCCRRPSGRSARDSPRTCGETSPRDPRGRDAQPGDRERLLAMCSSSPLLLRAA